MLANLKKESERKGRKELFVNLRQETVFTTSDNQSFKTRKEATIHELGLKLRGLLIDGGFSDQGQVKAMSLYVARNHEKFKPVFKRIHDAHNIKS